MLSVDTIKTNILKRIVKFRMNNMYPDLKKKACVLLIEQCKKVSKALNLAFEVKLFTHADIEYLLQ